MSNVRYSSLPVSEQRKLEIQDAKIHLVAEHNSLDEAIQNKIREQYSLSQEVSLLRKEVFELKAAIKEMAWIDAISTDNSEEFDEYNKYVEDCKTEVKENYVEERTDSRTE